MQQQNLKIAIQKKGHLRDESLLFLRNLGFDFDMEDKKLSTTCRKTGNQIIFLRDDDIPTYINKNLVDFGIIGRDVLEERAETTCISKNLTFSDCTLVIAVPQNSDITSVRQLQNKTIATSYPNIFKRFLKQQGIYANIVELSGSVEIAPSLGMADAVCDITQTGKTLRDNGLIIIDKVMDSQAILIESPYANEKKKEFLELIKKYDNTRDRQTDN
ncbi:MAG: ATP phosphoribosyltransferase [Candidatus Magasanikbacteria bacterium]